MKTARLLLGLILFSGILVSCGDTSSISVSSSEASVSPSTSTLSDLERWGPNYHVENTRADKKYIYGMDDKAWSDQSWLNIDYKYQNQLIKNLGAKSIRNWMHFNWVLGSPTSYYEAGLNLMKSIVADEVACGFQIIGLNHSNFYLNTDGGYSTEVNKPKRDLTEGSSYLKWLADYEQSWYMLTKAFPEITYWEIDNEPNNDDFFSGQNGVTYTLKQKAAIYTDMMYYGSQGIHRGNPNAVTVMGGLVTWNAVTFMGYLYDDIGAAGSWSKYPDDYFQVACWHPYSAASDKAKFISQNNSIYNVIKEREGKDKKVFLTEMGFSEADYSLSIIQGYLKDVYDAALSLPYIESMHYYKLFDQYSLDARDLYGLFHDPMSHGTDNVNPVLGAPKTSAYTYQTMAGGSGSLTVYQEVLNS
jgi:hypothetical protein